MGRSTTKKQNTTLLNMRNIIYILFFISLVKPQFSLYDNFKSLFNQAKITNEERALC